MSFIEQIKAEFADTPSVDAFGRLRVGDPGFRFDAQLTYQVNSDVWDTSTSNGTVAHSSTERWATLTANASGTNYAILQSHYHAPYTPGRSQLAFVTFLFGSTPGTGAVRRVGYFDGTNGIYLEQTESAVNLVRKSGTTAGTTTVPQASWNIDKLDGNGRSGKSLNLSNVQILVISFQALYVGRVIVGFDIDGIVVPVHQFVHANSIAYPYIQQASLPVRYEASTTSAAVSMNAICASVISEGGVDLYDIPGRVFTANNGTTPITGITTRRPILAVRPKSQLNSINQNAITVPLDVSLAVKTTEILCEIVRNGTLTAGGGAPAWTSVDTTYSTCEYSVNADAISNGQVLDSFYCPAAVTSRVSAGQSVAGKALLCYSHLLATADNIAVVVTRNAGSGNCEAQATLHWKEIR